MITTLPLPDRRTFLAEEPAAARLEALLVAVFLALALVLESGTLVGLGFPGL
ncbi:MAG TPA: hypothetical protein VML50_11305 [Anaeromyxobacter sp.]|nr:hypothetical protein [Anaeromyxobacter sp.]